MNLQATSYNAQLDSSSKEQVKRRLRSHAVSFWGLQETDADNLDPVIDLLLSACAVEFERTAHQVYASQARILERLAELMVPEVTTNARPAHAIMHACSDVPVTTLIKENLFIVDKEVPDGNKAVVEPITFSPVINTQLFDATLICQATSNKITFYDSPLNKGDTYFASDEEILPGTSIWLGLKIDKGINNIQGMSFFFDWKNQPEKEKFIPLLSTTQWLTENGTTTHIKNTLGQIPDKHINTDESDSMKAYEEHIIHMYHRQFCTISSNNVPLNFTKIPAALTSVYSEDTLSNFKNELLWLEVSFPEGVAVEVIQDIYCAVNCFPVINRNLHAGNRPFSLAPNLNIIPLTTDEHFLSVRKVFTSTRQYFPVNLNKLRELEDGAYSIKQSGINRFDQRDAETLLHYLYELMRDESASFKATGNYAIHSEIRGLEQCLSRLKLHLISKSTNQPSHCHLLLQTKNSEDVWVEFWTSKGQAGNGIVAGTKAKPLSNSNIKRTSLLFVTSTFGGQNPLSEIEKVHAYRFALLTRSRIATEEDLKAACFARLGDKIKHVEIKKGFKKEVSSRSGFVKTLDIIITPSKEFADVDWTNYCKEIESYIERHKLFLTAIQVYTSNHKSYANA
jgi:hypothetical protein